MVAYRRQFVADVAVVIWPSAAFEPRTVARHGSAAVMRDDAVVGKVNEFRLPAWQAAVGAVLSGALALLAFPAFDVYWLAPIAVALLSLTTLGQRPWVAVALGIAHGLAFFVPMLHWTGLYVGAWPWLLLASVQALYLGLLTLGTSVTWYWLRDVRYWPAILPIVTGAMWVAQEALRSRAPFGGFPWGRLAFSQGGSPLLPLAAVGGAPVVTFAVAVLGGALAAGVLLMWRYWPIGNRQTWLRVVAPAVVSGLVVSGCCLIGQWQPAARPNGDRIQLAVVQGNVPRAGLDFNAQRRQVLDNHVSATIELADRVQRGTAKQPDLVIWPENSSDIDPLINDDAAAQIDRAAAAIGVPILVGAVLDAGNGKVSNAGLVWEPGRRVTDDYHKRHPVPFAEYVPFRSQLRLITAKVDLVRRDFIPGTGNGTVTAAGVTLGDIICFEVAYDGLVADTVAAGAQLLVVQTNNATFGRSAESAQQLAMVRLRAVEHGRYAAMASTSGISAIVTPSGEVTHATQLFTQDVLVAEITLSGTRTVATNIGPWPEWLIVALAVSGILAGVLARRGRLPIDSTSSQETSTSVRPAQSAAQEPGSQRSESAGVDR